MTQSKLNPGESGRLDSAHPPRSRLCSELDRHNFAERGIGIQPPKPNRSPFAANGLEDEWICAAGGQLSPHALLNGTCRSHKPRSSTLDGAAEAPFREWLR
jgi:hypothetical protein